MSLNNVIRIRASFLLLLPLAIACEQRELLEVSGELKTWHVITMTLDGTDTSELDDPNPFTDYRLEVAFTGPSGTYTAPGYYAADGRAAETGASEGNKWRVHFTPNEAGIWRYRISFRTGKRVAIEPDLQAGKSAGLHGITGSFHIEPTDKKGRDFRGKGWLQYVGRGYLQFAATKEWFIKAGTDSPENFLAYRDFDGTWDRSEEAFLHSYAPHERDWKARDPTWQGGKGKGILGALNYLADKGMNSVYLLTMNVTGDGDDVWPWIDPDTRDRFDCSKLDQWNVVFSHMTRRGILLHVLTQETENDQLLDGGELGPSRKLYYRELIARFGHHPALIWNLGEENTNTTEQIRAFARFIHEVDPYDHPVVIHTYPDKKEEVYAPLLGFEYLEGASLQNLPEGSHATVQEWLDRSVDSGRPWLVSQDEQGPHQVGVMPDADDYEHKEVRDKFLWGSLLAGAAGVEWYMGYEYAHDDLHCEDWRSRDHMWDLTRYALEFMHEHVPFIEMHHADGLTSAPDDYVLAKPGEVYAIYLPRGGNTRLDLGDSTDRFMVRWYDPRTGGDLQIGSKKSVYGPGSKTVGLPPGNASKDWVVLVQKEELSR